jgi:hypothetical protein
MRQKGLTHQPTGHKVGRSLSGRRSPFGVMEICIGILSADGPGGKAHSPGRGNALLCGQ